MISLNFDSITPLLLTCKRRPKNGFLRCNIEKQRILNVCNCDFSLPGSYDGSSILFLTSDARNAYKKNRRREIHTNLPDFRA